MKSSKSKTKKLNRLLTLGKINTTSDRVNKKLSLGQSLTARNVLKKKRRRRESERKSDVNPVFRVRDDIFLFKEIS